MAGHHPELYCFLFLGKIIFEVKSSIAPNGGLAKFFVGAHSFECFQPIKDSQSKLTYGYEFRYSRENRYLLRSCEFWTLRHNSCRKRVFCWSKVSFRFGKSRRSLEWFISRDQTFGSPSNHNLAINDGTNTCGTPMDITWELFQDLPPIKAAIMYNQQSGKRKQVICWGTWEGNTIRFQPEILVLFVLAQDNVKPTISPVKISGSETSIHDQGYIPSWNSKFSKAHSSYGSGFLMRLMKHSRQSIWSRKIGMNNLSKALLF